MPAGSIWVEGHVRLALELTRQEAENRVAGGVEPASNGCKRCLGLFHGCFAGSRRQALG